MAALESDAPMTVIEPMVEELRGGVDADSGVQVKAAGRRKSKHKSASPPAPQSTADAASLDTPDTADVVPEPVSTTVQPSPVKQLPADWDSLVPLSPKEPLPSPRQQRAGAKTKRGALSLSLGRGNAAEKIREAAPQAGPSPLATKAPAWGRPAAGPPPPATNPSLKAILAQQAAEQPPSGGGKPADKPPRPGQTGVALSLGELIDAQVERRVAAAQAIAARKQGPAWGCAGGSPPGLSFADIQVHVVELRCYCDNPLCLSKDDSHV